MSVSNCNMDSCSRVSYTYNADGIRTIKTVNGVRHKYYLDGSKILGESWTKGGVEYFLYFIYDENGSPVGLEYRTSNYDPWEFDYFFFDKNVFGDIIGIYNESGRKICTYTYDAWGECSVDVIDSASSLELYLANEYNPFRYRGYYYDIETRYYYLQTRYYNPGWGRFLNADGYLNANGDILGYNMFAYCSNDPVNKIDPSGEIGLAILVIGLAVLLANTPGCSPKDGADAVAQVVEDVELGPYEAQDVAHGYNSASKAYDYANTFNSFMKFADSLDNHKAAILEYSSAVIIFRKTGRITYSQNMIDNFGSYDIYGSCLIQDANYIDSCAITFGWKNNEVDNPKFLSNCFNTWAPNATRKISAKSAKYSLEKGYEFYKNYFDIVSGGVGW